MKRARVIVAGTAIGLAATAFLALWLLPCPPLLEDRSFSRAFLDRDGRLLRLTLAADDRYRVYTPLDRISPLLVEATLLQEDRLFGWHPGFNPWALVRGAWMTVTGTGRSGGSTLTMQLARLRFGLKTRTPWGKLRQVARALQIELHYSKDEILEAYLNLAPYGRNIEGAEAASLVWFGKTADRLTLPEALTLCQIPRRPGPQPDREPARTRIQDGRKALFERWIERHPDDADARTDLELPVTLRPLSRLPRRAPHAVDQVAAGLPTQIGPGQTLEVRTTIDLGLQELTEQRVAAYIDRVRDRGITNAAVLLVDAGSLEVRALVGSADFDDAAIQGQVNGVRAPRSPGSALKPFVYGLAIDRGLIHPGSLLDDAPLAFRDFNPENFDRDFMGPIRAADALVSSRNLPAVSLAARLPPDALHDLLAAARVRRLGSAAHHGLALVLGGVEVSMEELVSLYTMLARRGEWAPLRLRADLPPDRPADAPAHVPTGVTADAGVRLLGPEAAWLTLSMLRTNPRPDRGYSEASAGRGAEVAWKTGTSAGYRDAWAVGVFGAYVLGVWIGNFDGRPNRAFVGREAAAPLMFDLVDAIRARTPGLAEQVPERPPADLNLAEVDVCAVSGRIPGESCPHSTRTWFVPGTSPIGVCTLHQTLEIDVRTGLRACPGQDTPVRREVFELWASDALDLFRRAGIPRRVPPPFRPDCEAPESAASGPPPCISSPRPGSVYNLRVGLRDSNDLPLKAISEAGVKTLHWFVDDRYLGARPSAETVLWPLEPGAHEVRVVDDHGRAASRRFRVRAEAGL